MDSPPAIELIHPDGTAKCKLQKYRFSATSNRGNPGSLLSELESNASPLPWISCASRDTALETIKIIPLDNDVKTSLIRHICNTGYLKDPIAERVRVFFAEESRGLLEKALPAGGYSKVVHLGCCLIWLQTTLMLYRVKTASCLPCRLKVWRLGI